MALFLFIVMISVITLVLLVVGAVTLYKDESLSFNGEGYILSTTTKKNAKYYFSANTKYKDNAIGIVTKFFGELIYTHPEKVIVFRDNNISDIGHILIDKCLAQNIPVISYNSLGHITPVNSANTDNPQKYYRVRHPNNVAIGETEELPR